jgi:hypothetical protein
MSKRNERIVLAALDAYWKTHYRPPTQRELVGMTGLILSTVNETVQALHNKGCIEVAYGARKCIPNWVKIAINNADPP